MDAIAAKPTQTIKSMKRGLAEGAEGIHFINIGCGPQTAYAAHAPFPSGHVRVSPNALWSDGLVANGAVRANDAFGVWAR